MEEENELKEKQTEDTNETINDDISLSDIMSFMKELKEAFTTSSDEIKSLLNNDNDNDNDKPEKDTLTDEDDTTVVEEDDDNDNKKVDDTIEKNEEDIEAVTKLFDE